MILLQINLVGMAVSKLECKAPRTIHMNRVACRLKALQRMKLRTGEVHVLWLQGLIEPV